MSNDVEHYSDPQHAMIAQFLMSNDGDDLTDILVAALEDAFRVLSDDFQTMH